MLIRLWVDVGRHWRSASPIGLAIPEQLEPGLDVRVARVELGRSLVGVKRIVDLVVAALIQSAQVIPNLRYEWVQTNGTRIRVQGVSVLVDLIIEHANGAPEGGVTPISVDSLLIGLVCLGILLLGHVTTPEQVPTLRIAVICWYIVSLALLKLA